MLSGVSQKQLKLADNNIDTVMSDDNKELVRTFEGIFDYAKKHRQVFMDRKARNYLMYVGKQWDMMQPSFKTVPVTNIIWGIIEYEVPLMTENTPIFRVLPGGREDVAYAEGAAKGLEYVWDSNNMTYRLPFTMRDVCVFGDAFHKSYWDYEAEEIVIDDVELDYIYPEPYVADIPKMKYFIHAEPRALYDIAEMYPNGKYVKAENISNEILEAVEEDASGSKYETRESLEAEGYTTSKEGKMFIGRALVKEIWINDKTMTTENKPVQDDYGNPVYKTDDKGEIELDKKGNPVLKTIAIKKRKYPYGRFVHWANGILLADGASTFKHGRAPLTHFHNIKMKRHFWSYGDPYQLTAIQTQLNKRKAQVDFMADQMGNSIWVVDADSGVKRGQITNRPGLVIYKRPGTDVHREDAPSIPEYMFRTADELKLEADFVSGMMGVVRGEKPGSVTAGTAIAELIERALVRVKEKVKYMEKAIVDMGRLNMSYIRQFWKEPRQFAITGMSLTQAQQQGQPQMIEFSGSSLAFDPNIKMVAGSTMTSSKATKFEQGTVMLKLGVIDREEFHKYIEYPNAEAVLARLEKQEQMQQQMQQQSENREFQLKMANNIAKIKTAEIAGKAKVQGQQLSNMGNLELDRQSQAFDLNKLLLGPPSLEVGKGQQGGIAH